MLVGAEAVVAVLVVILKLFVTAVTPVPIVILGVIVAPKVLLDVA